MHTDPEDTPVAGLQVIPPDALPSSDDIPTEPDLPWVSCPRCRGTLEVLTGKEGGTTYRRTLDPCDTCLGPGGKPTGFVTRAQHAQFHADHGGEIDTIPPPSS